MDMFYSSQKTARNFTTFDFMVYLQRLILFESSKVSSFYG